MIEFYETYASDEFLFSVVTQLQNDENQKPDIFYPLYRSLFIVGKFIIEGNSKDMLS